jgi:hypothetical protein
MSHAGFPIHTRVLVPASSIVRLDNDDGMTRDERTRNRLPASRGYRALCRRAAHETSHRRPSRRAIEPCCPPSCTPNEICDGSLQLTEKYTRPPIDLFVRYDERVKKNGRCRIGDRRAQCQLLRRLSWPRRYRKGSSEKDKCWVNSAMIVGNVNSSDLRYWDAARRQTAEISPERKRTLCDLR